MRHPKIKTEPAPAGTSAPVMRWPRFPSWLLAALLALVTIALYWPATRCDFINLDDPDYVTANPHVQGGLTWEGIKWAFTNTEQAAYWAPLMWLSHELACQLFGLNPWGHHLMNVLLHAANVALVFLVFQRMTGARWRSFILAALFGWHPLRVESVAWVTERKDVLSTLFWALTLLAYARYAQKSEARSQISDVQPPASVFRLLSSCFYWLALLFFALGLMSKAMLVTLPFVLLLLDYWPLKRMANDGLRIANVKILLLEKIPFFVLAAGAGVVTFLVQKQGGAVTTVEYLPLGARVGNALISYCRYLEKTFWPMDMAVFYPHPGYWPPAEVLLAGVFLCGISAYVIVKRREYPFMLMGWLWFVGTLVPVIQLVQSGGQAMADRFMYVPSLGVLIIAVWGACELARRWRHHGIVLPVAGLATIAACIGLTRHQLGYWTDTETLFRHTIAVTENNYMAHNNLGAALLKKGGNVEAMSQFQEALRLKPNYADAHINLGLALFNLGQTDKALRQYQEAIRLKPDSAEAHNNLGAALGRKVRTDEAISEFQEAVRLKPDYAEAHFNLGVAFLNLGQIDGAIGQFQETIRLKPDYDQVHNNLAVALFKQGRTDEAIRQLQEAVRLKPDDDGAQRNLAKLLELKNKSNAQTPGPAQP
jgi:Flp pilus assembly protein TadD